MCTHLWHTWHTVHTHMHICDTSNTWNELAWHIKTHLKHCAGMCDTSETHYNQELTTVTPRNTVDKMVGAVNHLQANWHPTWSSYMTYCSLPRSHNSMRLLASSSYTRRRYTRLKSICGRPASLRTPVHVGWRVLTLWTGLKKQQRSWVAEQCRNSYAWNVDIPPEKGVMSQNDLGTLTIWIWLTLVSSN